MGMAGEIYVLLLSVLKRLDGLPGFFIPLVIAGAWECGGEKLLLGRASLICAIDGPEAVITQNTTTESKAAIRLNCISICSEQKIG